MIRPSWEDYLLGLARCVSQRSHDIQTQHGCVIADARRRVLGMGYNGFPHGLDDTSLPAERPDKYAWMDHSEENAVANCQIRPEGATAYVTGPPCFSCLKEMWRHGIRCVIYAEGYGWKHDEAEAKLKEEFIKQSGMVVKAIKPDLSWLVHLVLDTPELRALLDEALRHDQ